MRPQWGARLLAHTAIPAVLVTGLYAGSLTVPAFAGSAAGVSPAQTDTPPPPPQARVAHRKPAKTELTSGRSRTQIDVKFRERSTLRAREGKLTITAPEAPGAAAAAQVDALDRILAGAGATIRRLHSLPEEKVAQAVEDAGISGLEQTDLDLWHRVSIPTSSDIASVIDQLNALDVVEVAYAAPLAAPLPASPDFRSSQIYSDPAGQNGIDADYAATIPGGTGANVQVHDVEYSWNTAHEDLAKLTGALVANGTSYDPFADKNHGTAVVGEMVADSDAIGVTGLVRSASLKVTNAANLERGYDLATSLLVAADSMQPGDVLLIEQQIQGPNGGCDSSGQDGCAPVEWIPSFYDSIRNVTSRGIIVVEAAGNGNQNLDGAEYGAPFPRGLPDSGAIVVGAGGAGNGCSPARSRMSFSNYGTRVDVQGWGECVATTGYGTSYSAGGVNAYYTLGFSGTSSASPIVASAAAVLSSIAQQRGYRLTARDIRTRLRATGTPQVFGTAGQIGPLPNLRAAIAALPPQDTTAPTVGPISYVADVGSQVSMSTVPTRVKWSASDASGVTGYSVRMRTNGGAWVLLSLPSATAKSVVVNLAPGNSYEVGVAAKDKLGNWSGYRISPTMIPSVRDENGANVVMAGGWTRVAWAQALGGFTSISGAAGASSTFTYSGRSAAYVATKGPDRGQVKIYVDGVLRGTVDLFAPTQQPRKPVATYYVAGAGTHSVRVQVVGTPGRPAVDVDGFVLIK